MADNDQIQEMLDLAQVAAAFAAEEGGSIGQMAETCPSFIKALRAVHPIKIAATYGALLTQKRLQPNCLRLEALVHLCVAIGQGSSSPTTQLLRQGYTAIGHACGYMEDPPEDIFVGNIYSKRGNYRVLEGIWESGTFYLQRFVNLTDSFPSNGNFSSIANSIHALLKVSDIVCQRDGLRRNDLGSERGENVLPRDLTDKSHELSRLVKIGFDELDRSGINVEDLSPFIFDPTERSDLLNQSISDSALEARPLAIDGNQVYLLLPTAISVAVRRFILTVLGNGENRKTFLHNLGREYSCLFGATPMLGDRIQNVPFSHMPWGSVCCASLKVDEGRYLNLVFFLDTLEDFFSDGFAGVYEGNKRLLQELKRATISMQDEAENRPGFRDGITLIIGCGIGRGVALETPVNSRENWEVDFLSAPDYCTLSRVKEMEPLNLWRIVQMRSNLEDMNVWLQNINGFLNLYAWADSLKGHLVPHSDIPEESLQNTSLNLAISQNSFVELRHKVVISIDCHAEQFVDQTWRMVVTEGASNFEEDNLQPIYAHLRVNEDGMPLGACITSNRCWWFDLTSPAVGLDTRTYDRWKLMGTWLTRSVQHLEDKFALKLGNDPILWRCVFENMQEGLEMPVSGTAQEAIDAILTTVDVVRRTVELKIGIGFDRAIHHSENIAERALVSSFVRGVAQLAGEQSDDLDRLINLIVPDTETRHAHMFPARHFRDYVRSQLDEKPITINQFDDAAAKLGIGWRVRNRDDRGKIEGKNECLAFLNALVRQLEDDLCKNLSSFNRHGLLSKLLLNHEIASASREHWHRTAAAVLALRNDKGAALDSMRDHELKLNAVFQASRILMEMAICESNVDNGNVPGDLDLSRLLTNASQLYHIGGWSDLVRWNLLEPLLIVRPLGDVHAKHDFIDTVMDSFGNATSEYRYMDSARNYAKNFEVPRVVSDSKGELEAEFFSAWREEFDVEFDDYRRFVDAVENLGIAQQKPLLQLCRSDLVALAATKEVGRKIVESLDFVPRQTWRQVPDGFDHKDIAPWRFRRRLSALRRPLLQVTIDDDPQMLLAPGLLRECLAYTVANYYAGSYPDWHLGPAMKKYAGYARNRDGMQFNKEVTQRMSELGWNAEPETTITKIVGKSLDRNYGDVDVLAWDFDSGRILVMECKDLQFRKTYGEIAEQLSDFLGEVSADGKRRDLLRKHLDRVNVLQSHISEVRRYLGFKGDCSIESIIVFRNPVPMQFAEGPIRDETTLFIFTDLHKFRLV
ncbi:MAG: zinc chelation protein SecC [Pseudomonadota bacterium]